MNALVNKFSLAGDKFMPELYLRQQGLELLVHSLKMKKE